MSIVAAAPAPSARFDPRPGAQPVYPGSRCRLIELPKVSDPRGNLTFVEQERHIPFAIQRVFYLYDVPGGESRAGHANKRLQEFIIAASGSFEVVVDNGEREERYFLNRSFRGLYVPGMLWRTIENFSSSSVCLVLASELYDEDDYYRDYDEYRSSIRPGGSETRLP